MYIIHDKIEIKNDKQISIYKFKQSTLKSTSACSPANKRFFRTHRISRYKFCFRFFV